MQRKTAAIGLVMVGLTWAQHTLIFSSIISLACFSVLAVSNPSSLGQYWNSSLGEYWIAGIAWMVLAGWLVKAIVPGTRYHRKGRLALTTMQRRTALALGVLAYVALTSPFLVPVGPNVQGNLVTTRLLPPLSTGYVRESWEESGSGPETTGAVERVFMRARGYMLNRRIALSGDANTFSTMAMQGPSVVVREFQTILLFGTDDNARDVCSRVISGTRISLGIGTIAALGAIVLGAFVGFVAGMWGGILDALLMRLTDLFLAIPSLFLVIGILAFIGQSLPALVLVLAVSGWMGIARVVRGEVVSLREREFILAAKLLHVSPWRIITRHFLPNVRPVILTAAVLQFANAVLGEAALGFLGLGIQPPTASWGNMLGEATGYLSSGWWVGVFPGLVLAGVIVGAHAIGEGAES